ncbi:2-C-methyl-D-erythritol 2,4-cyclodiphosphate synthase [Pleionea litopenaei]
MMRIGHGFDAHKFGGEPPLILGGVTVPSNIGLLAHSDGDVVLHAICDAILGALALRDIGFHFSDQSPEFSGIDSRELLRRVTQMMVDKQYKLGNLDVTIVAQTPRLSNYIESMRKCVCDDLQSELEQVNIKATTTEKMGYVGRKEGIAVHAVVLLMSEKANAI